MPIIREVCIKNFRSIQLTTWRPGPGLNCLIGPGDSGKSTILDAIDLALGARRYYQFSDADFYQLNTDNPIEITITLGNLPEALLNIDFYGFFLRGRNPATGDISDEPQPGWENVLTLKLTVNSDLDPAWVLYSDRAAEEGIEKRLPWKHRELISPSRLGVYSSNQLGWGQNSILNKLSENTLDVSAVLADAARKTRSAFAENPIEQVDDVLKQVAEIANGLGVPIDDLKALLDVKGGSLTSGAISLHDGNHVPLRQLGTGSTRLLLSGLQKAATSSRILLVDEAEYGLEPYRITLLLNELGSKSPKPEKQVFLTTHSPYVLRELQACQLHVVRRTAGPPFPPPFFDHSHRVIPLGNGGQEQATLRSCAEAFFSKFVIVGEGKTEVGLVRGLDLHCEDRGFTGIHGRGAFCVDGDGNGKCLQRAGIFRSLLYQTAIVQDSDVNDSTYLANVQTCRDSGIAVFEWGQGLATETALFTHCPLDCLLPVLQLAINNHGDQKINSHIENVSNGQYSLAKCWASPTDEIRPILGMAAGKYSWFKKIAYAEELARTIIGPNLTRFQQPFRDVLSGIFRWVPGAGGGQ